MIEDDPYPHSEGKSSNVNRHQHRSRRVDRVDVKGLAKCFQSCIDIICNGHSWSNRDKAGDKGGCAKGVTFVKYKPISYR
jgi:hypothetical protein